MCVDGTDADDAGRAATVVLGSQWVDDSCSQNDRPHVLKTHQQSDEADVQYYEARGRGETRRGRQGHGCVPAGFVMTPERMRRLGDGFGGPTSVRIFQKWAYRYENSCHDNEIAVKFTIATNLGNSETSVATTTGRRLAFPELPLKIESFRPSGVPRGDDLRFNTNPSHVHV